MRLSRLISDFRDLVSAAEDWAALGTITEDAARELGFEYVAVLHSRSLIWQSNRYIRHDNYPTGWDRKLVAPGHKIVDPILTIARRRNSGFVWRETLTTAQLTDLERSILEEARRLGIGKVSPFRRTFRASPKDRSALRPARRGESGASASLSPMRLADSPSTPHDV